MSGARGPGSTLQVGGGKQPRTDFRAVEKSAAGDERVPGRNRAGIYTWIGGPLLEVSPRSPTVLRTLMLPIQNVHADYILVQQWTAAIRGSPLSATYLHINC